MKAIKKVAPFKHKIDDVEFTIRGLTGIELLEVKDYVIVDPEKNTLIPAKGCAIALKYGLLGWEGFDVEFSTHSENMSVLPSQAIHELALEVLEHSDLGVEDKKKSS